MADSVGSVENDLPGMGIGQLIGLCSSFCIRTSLLLLILTIHTLPKIIRYAFCRKVDVEKVFTQHLSSLWLLFGKILRLLVLNRDQRSPGRLPSSSPSHSPPPQQRHPQCHWPLDQPRPRPTPPQWCLRPRLCPPRWTPWPAEQLSNLKYFTLLKAGRSLKIPNPHFKENWNGKKIPSLFRGCCENSLFQGLEMTPHFID